MSVRQKRIRLIAFIAAFCIARFNAALSSPVKAFSVVKETVLVLYGERLSIPAMRMVDQGLMAGLSRGQPEDPEVFAEYLDLARFPAAQYGEEVVRYLRARYAVRRPDVVIAVAGTALELALAHRDELFAGVPIVFADVDHRELEGRELPPNVTGLWVAWDYQRTVELVLQLQPKTRELVCVVGTGPLEQRWNNEAREVLKPFATRVRTRWLDKLPLPAVLDEVARLPSDSAVIYMPMLHDGAGKPVAPFQLARQLAEASRVPVYALSEPQLKQGIIGGALLDFSEIGRKTAALAFRVLAGEMPPPTLLAPDPTTNPLLVNWQALKKWHVSNSRVPREAAVLYREPSLWKHHPRLIIATAATLVLQSLLIMGLINQRSRLKRAERSLRESEARFRTMADTAPVMIWMSGPDKLCTFFNKGWLEFTGRPLEQQLGNGWAEGVHPEDRDCCLQVYVNSFEARQPFTMEYRLRRSDGEYRWVLDNGGPRFAADGTFLGYIGSCMDITERKQAEAEARKHREELAHLSRIAIMGELTGALAHELNQPLTSIMNNAGAGRRFIAKGRADLPKLDGLFEDVIEDGRRAGGIIRGIRGMVQKSKEVRGPVNVNDVIAGVLRFVHSDALERHCMLITELDPELPLIEGDRVQLQQVLLNLTMNAIEAMSETRVAERRVIVRSEREPDGRVRVSVRDFGTGLPAEEPQRIFEQFFSTKRDGMGMGLAIARSIIVSHEGQLDAANAEGGGACIHFTLPVITKSPGT